MAIWSGIGVNYGHNFTIGNYSTALVENDYTFLRSMGVSKIRIALPGFQSSLVADCEDMAVRAMAHGFYVTFGIGTGYAFPNLTATVWASYKTYITGTFVPWAIAHGLTELSLGNEEEAHLDGTTLTSATMQADVRSMASAIKSGTYGAFTGKVSYNTSIASPFRDGWVANGIGALDLIGWNSYDSLNNFTSRASLINTDFGTNAYVSEFGAITLGYADYNLESLWYTDVVNRINVLIANSIQSGYFYTYRDGSFGSKPDTFALVLANGDVRQARYAVFGLPIPKTFDMTMM